MIFISKVSSSPSLSLPHGTLSFGVRPLICGILNVTPDSFYDGGSFFKEEEAVSRAKAIFQEGADLIDLGGQSTRPGSLWIGEKEEWSRIKNPLKKIRNHFPNKIISVDTVNSEIARRALEEGADIINDISTLKASKGYIATVTAHYKAGLIISHMKGNSPKTMQKNPKYENVMKEVCDDLKSALRLAKKQGQSKNKIILDPGFGFGKTIKHNLELLSALKNFRKKLKCPIMAGLSRKSMFQSLLGLPAKERLNATLIYDTVAAIQGTEILRVHDVKEHTQLAILIEALRNIIK